MKPMTDAEKTLNLSPFDMTPNLPGVKVIPIESDEPEDTDYDYARKNYYEMIQQGQVAMAEALRVAMISENPRAYEVVSGLMKNLADINKQLVMMGVDKQQVKITRKGAGGQQVAPAQITQNNVFVGNSADLNKLLAGN